MTHMLQSLDRNILNKVEFLVGTSDMCENAVSTPAKAPFAEEVVDFLNEVSKTLMSMKESRAYPEIITLAFWMRKSSILKLKEKYCNNDGNLRLGQGVAFHIAPSNVPVNYAYSLVTGLLSGNVNIVRVPSKEYEQVSIINSAINNVLDNHRNIKPYIYLVRYDRDHDVNCMFSLISDVRVIWGGDATISEIRKAPLPSRSTDITFADRYSLAVINSDDYLDIDDKNDFANKFYNDTYFTDQNACTSPRIVVWTGNNKTEAKKIFWNVLHDIVKEKYELQPVLSVNKLTSSYLAAANIQGVKIIDREDNYIVRVELPHLDSSIMELKDNSGYFFEYDCDDIMELREICNSKKCQTIALLGNAEKLYPLVLSGVRGVDRIVPFGKTMDFELIWDGMNLIERMTRVIKINEI